MRLVEQTSLRFQEGRSDKVYEVDLCEVGAGQFVVNFRYGRFGSTLVEATRTSEPVSLDVAKRMFETLVAEKTGRGYRDASEFSDVSPPQTSPPEQPVTLTEFIEIDPREAAVLKRLAEGNRSRWRLSRAAWRAGEMRVEGAEPLLLKLLGSGDAALDYSIAWSLGQLGGAESIEALRKLEADRKKTGTVRRIAAVALLNLLHGEEKQAAHEACLTRLPESLANLARHGSAEELDAALQEHLATGDHGAFADLDMLYLIDSRHIRPVLLKILRTAPLQPSYFQRFRHIFKAAELRRDAEVFGIIAHRIETVKANFTMPDPWYFKYSNEPKPTVGPNASKAFSLQTRFYLRRRIWWTVNRLGELNSEDYVPMAAGVLAAFTDEDAKAPYHSERVDWDAYQRSDWRNRVTINTHYDTYGSYWAFNQILYGNSPRYEPDAGRRFFCCRSGYSPGGTEPREREEAYPELWDRRPELVLDLIGRSRCEAVHRFALKVLRGAVAFCDDLSVESLLVLLRAPYEVTAEFGFDLAVRRYDPQNPNPELILALANCAFQRAREQSFQWIGDHKQTLLQDHDFVIALVTSPFADTRSFARDVLRQIQLTADEARTLIARLCAHLQTLGDDEAATAEDVCDTLLKAFGAPLRSIGTDVVRDLLSHPLSVVQKFAGDLVLAHETLSRNPPADVLQALLEADDPTVRGIGVRIIGQLPDDALKNSIDLLFGLTRHERADIREAIRPTVVRLANADAGFGRDFAERLLNALLTPGAPEGVPSHTARILREDLRDHLTKVTPETVWKLLQSRSSPAQEIGGLLLPTNVRTEELNAAEIVKLANHEILSVREAAWALCDNKVDRLRADAQSAARMLDARWEDTRRFAFTYFLKHFTDDNGLPPDVLVGICDSVRPDVQRFGRDLIARVFQDGHGEEYVLKLSEHPAEPMQLFATNFLERHAADSVEKLNRLAPYFVSVLSRVNKGRVAKDRAYRFLEKEALKSEAAAKAVAEILARQSATVAIGDKATTIEVMLRIHDAYPSIELPLQIQPVEVRGGV